MNDWQKKWDGVQDENVFGEGLDEGQLKKLVNIKAVVDRVTDNN